MILLCAIIASVHTHPSKLCSDGSSDVEIEAKSVLLEIVCKNYIKNKKPDELDKKILISPCDVCGSLGRLRRLYFAKNILNYPFCVHRISLCIIQSRLLFQKSQKSGASEFVSVSIPKKSVCSCPPPQGHNPKIDQN